MKILGLGTPELIVILIVVLVIFGPKNLPKLGASIGKGVRNLRKGMDDDDKPKDASENQGTDATEVEVDEAPVEADDDDADNDVKSK